eukprot:Nitzschia sp. Nitz4//scaffold174_size87051//38600//39450//NITZ4_005109-RA/size87051-augustus-gene-0.70-mRNA-1//-1//CDS//3329538872//3873//frame0
MESPSLSTLALCVLGGSAAVAAKILLTPILWPRIETFPWSEDTTEDQEQTVILAGSYNPPHLGHLAMLEYLARRYKRVIAVVGFNPNKKYAVTPEQRKDLLQKMIATTKATNIQVEVVEGYIWRYGKRHGASLFFRGIRSWEADGEDERALQILNTWGPLLLGPLFWPIPTQYLEGNPKYNHVSSTLIRSLCGKESSNQKALEELVPAEVADLVSQLYGAKQD